MALALVGMPLDKLPLEVIRDILAGGESVCADAGIPIAGGHSIDVLEPIYGLVALGIVHPKKVKRNNQAKAGDKIILGKPLGVGILSAALKKGILSAEGYAQMIRYTTQLNRVGVKLSDVSGVHALTDVTGFGLAGHLLEICRGSNLSAEIEFSSIPMIKEALSHVQAGIFTGASTRNWAGYGKDILLTGNSVGDKSWQQQMMTDPQTSGGLLVACSPETEQEVLGLFHSSGFEDAKTIGELVPVTNTPCIKVTI